MRHALITAPLMVIAGPVIDSGFREAAKRSSSSPPPRGGGDHRPLFLAVSPWRWRRPLFVLRPAQRRRCYSAPVALLGRAVWRRASPRTRSHFVASGGDGCGGPSLPLHPLLSLPMARHEVMAPFGACSARCVLEHRGQISPRRRGNMGPRRGYRRSGGESGRENASTKAHSR